MNHIQMQAQIQVAILDVLKKQGQERDDTLAMHMARAAMAVFDAHMETKK